MRQQQYDSKIWTNNVRVFAVVFVVGLGNPVKTPHSLGPCGPSICGAGNPSEVNNSEQSSVASAVIDQYGKACADIKKCVDDVYKNYFHPKQKEINDNYTAEYKVLALGALGSAIGGWLQFYFTNWDIVDVRGFFKETWKTLLLPSGLLYIAGEIDSKIRLLEIREKAENDELDRETIRRINECNKL
ncbi:MAG: hypothetical protein U5N85_11155 [Arcicella sp.]|nr:hypothetical protein [Arcicella sp.]